MTSSLRRCGIGLLMRTVGGVGKILFTAYGPNVSLIGGELSQGWLQGNETAFIYRFV